MRRLRPIALLVVLVAAAVALYLDWPYRATGPAPLLGYVEGESILAAPKTGGRLVDIAVAQGDAVDAGALLFRLDADKQREAVAEASAQLDRSKATLADLEAARQRPQEIDVLQASRRQAAAALALAQSDYERQKKLFATGVIAQARLDDARSRFDQDQAALAEIDRQIAAARLAGRIGQIDAARADVAVQQAALARARTDLDERTVSAPEAGRVLDVFYRQGEIVGAGQPVVEILPPQNVLIRFFVPETRLARLARGSRIGVACDGCPQGLQAEVIFVSPDAEFTPPVIFTRTERAKLVFLVKARPLGHVGLFKPGLPVEVSLAEAGTPQ